MAESETTQHKRLTMSDMAGTYEFVNHGLDASTADVGMLETSTVKLGTNGKITGDYTGTWLYTDGTYYCKMVIDGVTYKGVFFKQKDETSSHKEVMTFTLIGKDNQSIWGTKTEASTENTEESTEKENEEETTSSSSTTAATWNFSSSSFNGLGTISSSKTIDNLTLNATSSKKMSIKKGSTTYDGTTYSYYLALSGTGSASYRSVAFDVNGSSTVTIVAKSSGSSTRYLYVCNSEGDILETLTVPKSVTSVSYKYSGNADTLYIYSKNSGINLFEVSVK